MFRELDELAGLGSRWRQRLLHERVLAGVKCPHRQVEVSEDRCRDYDRVQARIVEQIVVASRRAGAGVAPADSREALRIEVADIADLHARLLNQAAEEIGSPVSEADHSYPQRG